MTQEQADKIIVLLETQISLLQQLVAFQEEHRADAKKSKEQQAEQLLNLSRHCATMGPMGQMVLEQIRPFMKDIPARPAKLRAEE